MKRLIVNADDLGADEGRNAGILETVRAGAVKSVSLLANGPATTGALKAIRQGEFAKVSIGVHLNLSEGKSISSGLRLLAGGEGAFPGKTAAQRLLSQENNPELEMEILREVEAQIGLLQDAGISLSHLDGHQHLHIFPAVRKAAMRAAGKHGIPWIRIAWEPSPVSEEDQISEELKTEAKRFSDLSAGALPLLVETGIRAPDHFRGLYWKGRLSSHLLEKHLAELPEGLTEFMVHPGRVRAGAGAGAGPFGGFSTSDRENELAALLSPSFPKAVLQSGVSLISFREALP